MKRLAVMLAFGVFLAASAARATEPAPRGAQKLPSTNTAILCYLASQPKLTRAEVATAIATELTRRAATCNAETIAAGEARYASAERKLVNQRMAPVTPKPRNAAPNIP